MAKSEFIKLATGTILIILGGNWTSMLLTETMPAEGLLKNNLPFIIGLMHNNTSIIPFIESLDSQDILIYTKIFQYIIFPTLLIIGIFVAYSGGRSLIDVHINKSNKVRPKKCMLIFLSDPRIIKDGNIELDYEVENRNGETYVKQIFHNKKLKSCILLTRNLNDDIELVSSFGRWNWQQLLRALTPHKDNYGNSTLEFIYLIASKESISKLEDARELLKTYSSNNIIIEPKLEKNNNTNYIVNFDDLEGMVEYIDNIINKLMKREYNNKIYSEKDIIIDVTGGKKIASIAGAVVTLNKKVTFQYVETEHRWEGSNVVYEFDARHWLNLPR